MDDIIRFFEGMGFMQITWGQGIMLILSFFLLYLAIVKKYEPLLLLPIAFGMLLTNLPAAGMYHAELWTAFLDESSPMFHSYGAILKEAGLLDIMYMGVKMGLYPCLIFMGVGALTDFGPMLRNLKLAIFGAGAQFGIFAVLLVGSQFFTMKEAGSLAIIGGADGPTAIFTTLKLAPHMLGPIAIAAYSYMALVPVIIPLVVKLTCSKEELSINMKQQDKLYPSKTEFKNMAVLKILFPITVTVIVALIVPDAISLIGMLMFGNLIKEVGTSTSRLFSVASNGIMNAATIFLGLSVGATMTVDAFLNLKTIGIVAGGFLAFGLSIFGGILLAKAYNKFSKKKINPLIGATGLSAVPMASRVANDIALKYDPKNHVLNYCMSSNVAGVIGSAVAAGILIKFLG